MFYRVSAVATSSNLGHLEIQKGNIMFVMRFYCLTVFAFSLFQILLLCIGHIDTNAMLCESRSNVTDHVHMYFVCVISTYVCKYVCTYVYMVCMNSMYAWYVRV